MWLPVNLFLFLYISKICADAVPCTTPDGKQGSCVFADYCPSVIKSLSHSNLTRESVKELICNETIDTVCCTAPRTLSDNGTKLSDKRFCGLQHTDDYEYKRNDTSIDEFPWLAAIVGISLNTNKERIFCHGSLINTRYLLSAAQCFSGVITSLYNITRVLLGEYHRNTVEDCVELPEFAITECIKAEEFQIEEKIIHPFYTKDHLLADIALLRLDRDVMYSDYIRPICLPIQGTVFAKSGEILYTTGWGGTTVGGEAAVVKKKIATVLMPNRECREKYYKDHVVLPEINYICSMDFENNTAYSCQGDSGAPVMFKHKNQWHVEGIVAKGRLCSNFVPGIHTRVAGYLEWIKQNIET